MIRIVTSFVLSLAFLSCETSVPQFDSQSAFKYLIKQCDFGPRNPGSKGHENTKNYILDITKAFADSVIVQNFSFESALEFKDNKNKNLYNLDKFNSYHYEIMNISNLLINRKIFENDSLDVSLKKIENKIELLSDWFEY